MKRASHLFERIVDYDNICLAYTKAVRGKRMKREVVDFTRDIDANLSRLCHELRDGTFRFGDYHYFRIHDPKERSICAASFPERVVHHAIMNVCHDYFDRTLIDNTFASRKGKGVYMALDKAKSGVSAYREALKLDYRKYFDSIDHDVLKHRLRCMFKDEKLLYMMSCIIDSYHTSPRHGLPIGNLTSQYFANHYLSELDHMVSERMRMPLYIRYMDDILLLDDDRGRLRECFNMMEEYSTGVLHITLKSPIYRSSRSGVPFLGYRVMPHYLLLGGRSKKRYRSKMLLYERLLKDGIWDEGTCRSHALPLNAFACHASSRGFRRSVIEETG